MFKPAVYCYALARKDRGGAAAHVMERVGKAHLLRVAPWIWATTRGQANTQAYFSIFSITVMHRT